MSRDASPVDGAPRLTGDMLLRGYAIGIFPMSDDRRDRDIYWVEPRERAILPLDGLHLNRSLRRALTRDRFTVTSDRAFGAVLEGCATAAPGRETTWINGIIEQAVLELHARGHAHSVECWEDGELVGGLYGIALGRAFFGESMFSRTSEASKVALAWLVARLRVGGFALLDCQFMTDHLASMGAIQISRSAYLARLYSAVSGDASAPPFATGAGAGVAGAGAGAAAGSGGAAVAAAAWGALDARLAGGASSAGAAASISAASSSPGQRIVQLLTNTS